MTGTRQTNPALDLHDLPNIDVVLLSHYHADHFDQEVEASLRRDLPIITTPHAKDHLASKGDETFTEVFDLDFFQSMMVNVGSDTSKTPRFKVTGMPGKHVPDGIIGAANDIAGLVKFFPPSRKNTMLTLARSRLRMDGWSSSGTARQLTMTKVSSVAIGLSHCFAFRRAAAD